MTIADTLKMIKENVPAYEIPKEDKVEVGDKQEEKKRVYGVCLDPSEYPKPDQEEKPTWDPILSRFAKSSEQVPSNEDQSTSEKPKKQHRGLRCIKCFSLLVRDEDFDYINGLLWVDNAIVKGWDGLQFRGSWVYCQKMHVVGTKKSATWTNKTKPMIVIKTEKTTFSQNFLHNPEFLGSEKIRNKMQMSERGNEGMWRQLSLPPQQFLPAPAPIDRYHKTF